MNRINPNKLLHSKWTARAPQNQERHFMVMQLMRDENNQIISCALQAVINNHSYEIDWRTLKDSSMWIMGWH
jgi:tryptophan-rich hypothetical protein